MEFETSKKFKKPRKSYFLGCFGFSTIEKELISPLLSLSKNIKKHSSSAKTIPVDISGGKIHVLKVKTPVITGEVTQAPVVKGKSLTNIVHEKAVNKTKDHKTKDINHKNNKSLDQLLDKVHENSTCRNEFSRSATICSTHNLSHLINPTKEYGHEIKLSHSTSLPPPKRNNSVAETATRKVNTDNKKSSQQRLSSDNNFDSIIGMSILMVTLLIMLFWGKACAIVCTCVWFYFIPRLRPKNKAIVARKNGMVAGDVNVESEEYKKKVVLEGLLKRNHRNGVGFL
ncbi:unnamed protein product [Withania somnifera]